MARSCSGWSTANYFSRADAALTVEPLTLFCWWLGTGFSTSMRLVTLAHATGSGLFAMELPGATAGDPLRARTTDDVGAGGLAGSSTNAPTGWHMGAARFPATSSRQVYWGNSGTALNSGTSSAASGTVTIGTQAVGVVLTGTAASPWVGSLALPTIWNVSLSVEELTALKNGVHPARIRPKNIVRAWWNPTAGSRLVDFSGGANNLSLTGTVTDDAFGPPVEPYPFSYPLPWMSNSPEIGVAAGGLSIPVAMHQYRRQRAA